MKTNVLKETIGAKLTEVDNSTLQLAKKDIDGWRVKVCDINDITRREELEDEFEDIRIENNLTEIIV